MSEGEYSDLKKPEGSVKLTKAVWSGMEKPDDWEKDKLSNRVESVGGYAFSSDKFTDKDSKEATPLIKRKTINNNKRPDTYTTEEFKEKYRVEDQDILISMDGHFNCILWNKGKAALNQRTCLLKTLQDNNYFLSYLLDYPIRHVEAFTGATTVKSLSMKEFDKIEIPVPSLGEQERIASVLYSVDELIGELRGKRDNLQETKQGLMQDLLTGEKRVTPEMKVKNLVSTKELDKKDKYKTLNSNTRNKPSESDEFTGFKKENGECKLTPSLWSGANLPEGWSSKKVGDNVNITTGNSFSGEDFDNEEESNRLVLIKNKTAKEQTAKYYIDEEIVEDKYKINYMDILVTMDGDFKPRLWKLKEEGALNQRVCKLESIGYNKFFLRYSLEYPLDYRNKEISGTTVKHLSKSDIKNLILPTPPLWEQERIASVLYTVDEMISTVDDKINCLEELKKGLMQDLLTGEKRTPQNLQKLEQITGG